jgi:acetyl esterase/lipase
VPLDPHAKRFLDMLGASAPAEGLRVSASQRRQAFGNLMKLSASAAPAAEVAALNCPGPDGAIALRSYAPSGTGARVLPGLVYFHGGGLVAGDLDTHDGLCRTLATAAGCRVVAVDYRLAPEHRFPAAVDDSFAAMQWVARHATALGIDGRRLGVAGDSAGGGLAAAVCGLAREDGGPAPTLQLLLCPVLDLGADTPSRRDFARGYFLDAATIARDIADYSPDQDLANPLISPLRAARFDGLPRTLIHTAEFDPLRDEGKAYADALAAAGVAVSHVCHAGLIHHFYGLGGIIPAARSALAEIGAEAHAALG